MNLFKKRYKKKILKKGNNDKLNQLQRQLTKFFVSTITPNFMSHLLDNLPESKTAALNL